MRTPMIVLVLLFSTAALADTTTGLVGYWPFTGDAQDASGNNNHGALVNWPTLTADRHGNLDSAYHFDGLGTRIDMAPSASLDSPTAAITMAAYIRRDGWGMVGAQYSPILTKSISTAENFQYRFITTSSGLGTAFNHWNTASTLPYDFSVDQWFHVASTWEADTAKSYVNGQLLKVEYLPTTLTGDGRHLSIGSDMPGIMEIFYGDIDEVRIYNRALSPADIAELVDHLSPTPLAFHTGPVLHSAAPNPFNPRTTIRFELGTAGTAHLRVYDLSGRLVKSLADGLELAPGTHRRVWDGRDASGRMAAAGVYVARLEVAGETKTTRLVLVK